MLEALGNFLSPLPKALLNGVLAAEGIDFPSVVLKALLNGVVAEGIDFAAMVKGFAVTGNDDTVDGIAKTESAPLDMFVCWLALKPPALNGDCFVAERLAGESSCDLVSLLRFTSAEAPVAESRDRRTVSSSSSSPALELENRSSLLPSATFAKPVPLMPGRDDTVLFWTLPALKENVTAGGGLVESIPLTIRCGLDANVGSGPKAVFQGA